MRLIAIIFFSFFVVSCADSLTDSVNEKFQTKSKIKPIFEPKTFNQKIGNGQFIVKKLKIPLSKDTVGHYSYSEIIDDDSLDVPDAGLIDQMWQGLRHGLYNLGLMIGVSNRVRYTADYDGFPSIDSDYIKSVKVKKIFFAIEPCHPKDEECIVRNEKDPASLKFLDKFFVNLSIVRPEDDKAYLKEPLSFLSKTEFNQFADRAFTRVPFRFEALEDEYGEIIDDAFYNVNIARFENKRSPREFHENVRDEGKVFWFQIDDSNPHAALDIIKFFKDKSFVNVVKDTMLVGNTLYVELFHRAMRQSFFDIINLQTADMRSLGVLQFQGCSYVNCVELEVNELNLVPMLKRSTHLRFDTFLSLRNLNNNDFKYKGYLELEVKLNIPL